MNKINPYLPLQGIRIIDHGIVYTGTAATTMLADLGAEVIRVESISRFFPWTRGVIARPPNPSPGYPQSKPGKRPWDRWYQLHANNRNKYAITLELKQPEGLEVYKKLVSVSDIIIENFTYGVMDRFGLGYNVLKSIKPDIIMVSASGLGATGPYKEYSTFGTNIDSICGMMASRGYPNDDPLMKDLVNVWADNIAAGTVAHAALVALYYRMQTGKGQHIDLSQAEAFLLHMGESVLNYTFNGKDTQPMGNDSEYMVPHGCYRCQGEDQWVTIAVEDDKGWEIFCAAIGNPDWVKNKKYSDITTRWKYRAEINALVEQWTLKHTSYEVMCILQSAGIAAGAVLTPKSAYDDPHLEKRGFFKEITHPETGTHKYPGTFFSIPGEDISVRIPAPRLGEHNTFVLHDILGLDFEEIQSLAKKQIIGDAYLPNVP